MKTLVKLIAGLLVALVLAVGAAAVLLPKYVNPNDYKDQVTAQIEKATGRKLALGGDLKLSVFPWLGVDVAKVSLGNAQGFGDQPMFAADKLTVRVQLVPLITKRALLVDTVIVEGADIRLARNKKGVTNFDDLTGKDKESGDLKLAALILNGLSIKDSSLAWDDQQQGKRYKVSSLAVSTGELAFDSPIPLAVAAAFEAPAEELVGSVAMKGDVTIDKAVQRIKVAPLNLNGKLKGKTIPGGASDIRLATDLDLDLAAGTAGLAGLVLTALESEIKGDIAVRDLKSAKPAASGKVAVHSANGPGLIGVLTGRPATGKAAELDLNTAFNVDLKAGVAKVSELNVRTAGTDVKGNVDAANIGGKNSSVAGSVNLASTDLSAVLAAYGVAELPVQMRNVSGSANISGTAQKFKLEPIALAANIAGGKLPAGDHPFKVSTSAAVDMDKQTLALSNLAIDGLGVNARGNLSASGIREEPRYSGAFKVAAFNLRQLLEQLGQTLPVMADPNALTQVAIDTQVAGNRNDVTLSGLNLTVDESRIKGDMAVANIADPAVSFALSIDAINLDRYLAPQADVRTGDVAVAATAPGGAAAAAAATELPVETLRKLKMKGEAGIGALVIRKARLHNVRVAINARDGDIRITPAADLYEGKYRGNISLNAAGAQPVLNLDESLTGIQVEPLLTDLKGKSKLRGKGDVSARLTAAGNSTQVMKQTLNGQAAFVFRNGAYKGINLGKLLRKAQSGFVAGAAEEETDFTEMGGTVQFVNGVAHNNDLAAKSPLLRIDGKGSANLVTEQIDYVLNANVVATAQGQGGKELANLAGFTVPIRISGTFDNPQYGPDFAGMAKARVEQELQKQLGKQGDKLGPAGALLQGVLGGGQQPAPADTGSTAPAATQPDPAQQLLEGVLGGKQAAPTAETQVAAPAPAPAPEKQLTPEEQAAQQVQDAMKKLLKF